MVRVKNRRVYLILSLFVAFMFSVCSFSTVAFAETVSEEQAMNNLTAYVEGKMEKNQYSLEQGGTMEGKNLFTGDASKGFDLDETAFNKLSSKAQNEVVSDIATYSNEAIGNAQAKGVEESTVQNWWKQLQTKQGVGSKFMNEILKNTKPDFVTANQIYKPFSNIVSVVIGVIAVIMMGFLGIVMVSDIAYITLPPLRIFVEDGNGKAKSKIFTNDAIYAVQVAEEGDGGGGSGSKKQALGIYFKRRVVMLILLGICLLYLVQGQLYTLVGYILDLVSGFLGF